MSTTPTPDYDGRQCDLCKNEAATQMQVTKEGTNETKLAYLCPECEERTEAYTRGEEVEWPDGVDSE